MFYCMDGCIVMKYEFMKGGVGARLFANRLSNPHLISHLILSLPLSLSSASFLCVFVCKYFTMSAALNLDFFWQSFGCIGVCFVC